MPIVPINRPAEVSSRGVEEEEGRGEVGTSRMHWKIDSLRRGAGEERLAWRIGETVEMWVDHFFIESRASVGR